MRNSIFQDIVICVNETRSQQYKILSQVQKLTDHINVLQHNFMDLVTTRIDVLDAKVINAELAIVLDSCLSLLEGYVEDG